MMKKQYETLSQWKQKVHDANVANREKFEQTRALITALRSENEELQTSVKDISSREVKDGVMVLFRTHGVEVERLWCGNGMAVAAAMSDTKHIEI